MIYKSKLTFFHGWGMSPGFWHDWPNIADVGSCSKADRGYFTKESVDLETFADDSSLVLVTHSLGLHFVPPALFARCENLIVIAGFRSFHELAQDEAKSRSATRVMRRKLVKSAAAALDDFYNLCGLNNRSVAPTINTGRLGEDLELLDKCILDLRLLAQIPNISILHGANDKVVNIAHAKSLAAKLPQARLRIKEGIGHGLGAQEVEWCRESLRLPSAVPEPRLVH